MPRESPYWIKLSREERHELEQRVRKYTSPYFQVVRARIVLLAADGWRNDQIAEYVHTSRDVVSGWRKRFFEERLAGLDERPRPGRPRVFPPGRGRAGKGARL